jgi:hypothetical protein
MEIEKERKPNIQRWYYVKQMKRYENPEYTKPISPVRIAIVADNVWSNYCSKKLKEMAKILGYEVKYRNEISDYKTRRVPKLRLGRQTLYLLKQPPASLLDILICSSKIKIGKT